MSVDWSSSPLKTKQQNCPSCFKKTWNDCTFIAVLLNRNVVTLNKPRYVGTAVLGLPGVENIKNVVKISY